MGRLKFCFNRPKKGFAVRQRWQLRASLMMLIGLPGLTSDAQKCDLEFSLVQKILSQVLNKLSEALNRFEIPSDCDDEEREFCSTYSKSIELRVKKWSDELKLLPQLAKDLSLF